MSRPRDQLSQLHIPLGSQQPQGMHSPALPTALQNYHPGFPMGMNGGQPIQTPMQQNYFNIQPGPPGRHRPHASIAHMPGGNMNPPISPFTPGHFPSPSMMYAGGPPLGSPGGQFIPRSRRAPSVSTGPPKAVLGGPGRKQSPLPPPVEATVPAAAQKTKKVTINLPKETVPGTDGAPSTRAAWAREPTREPPRHDDSAPPELTSGELYPSDGERLLLPGSVDVFLPGKAAWETLKRTAIEEKLEKLGVERANAPSSSIPHIHAPHARAASISSPADPALLFFKLNKLQQTQSALSASHADSSTNDSQSTSVSPQPGSSFLNPSTNHVNPFQSNLSSRFLQGAASFNGLANGNRHGHSMSLAHPPTHAPFQLTQPPAFQPIAYGDSFNNFNPFGPVFAPQARAPVGIASLAPPLSLPSSRPDSRPDFSLGFGLDIPEEEEEEEEAQRRESESEPASGSPEYDEGGDTEEDEADEGTRTATHSRHVSHVSVALSLATVGGNVGDIGLGRMLEDVDEDDVGVPARSPRDEVGYDDLDEGDANEWTGSEDLDMREPSDDESIGEWSNPSDEERARQDRAHRRLRRNRETQEPRRLPNFPRPPTHRMHSDDLISNPSEEGAQYLHEYYVPTAVTSPGRPLPPLPHSRATSIQHSVHDPAYAHSTVHSRSASELVYAPLPPPSLLPVASSLGGRPRSDSLNPFAAPFVFGAPVRQNSGSWNAISPLDSNSHSRVSSFAKPLSAAAVEFRPGFSFKHPAGVPQLSFPEPELQPRVSQTPVRAQQGREKRQRRVSSTSEGGDEEEHEQGEDSGTTPMNAFRFPSESPQSVRRPQRVVSESPPASPAAVRPSQHARRQSSLNAAAPPFTFGGFSMAASAERPMPDAPASQNGSFEETASTAKGENDDEQPAASAASTSTSKRLPIPFDFKPAPISNTVPAGLFKALVNNMIGEERTRKSVRSRLSSHDIFNDHASPRRSFGELEVPSISRTISRNRAVNDPGYFNDPQDDMFSPNPPRPPRAGNPSHSTSNSVSSSGMSFPAIDLSARITFQQQYEQRLEAMLDDKVAIIRRDLVENRPGSSGLMPSTEAMIHEVVSLFRTQLSDSAARGLDEGQMEARGEIDLELIKGAVQQGHQESLAWLQQGLAEAVQRLSSVSPANGSQDLVLFAEQLTNRTLDAVVHAVSQLSVPPPTDTRLDRDNIVNDLLVALTPTFHSLRPEIVDYDYLTSELSQAVKPHISQLIDLASDKRETAGLIVEQLLPLLPGLRNAGTSATDTSAMINTLTSEIRRLIAPLDAFEIKEQVADLVVERLDSRLAVRDRTFNIETVTEKVADRVTRLFQPVHDVSSRMGELVQGQQVLRENTTSLSTLHEDVVSLLSDLPSQLSAATTALGSAQAELSSRPAAVVADVVPDANVLLIKTSVDELASSHKAIAKSNDRLISLHQDVLNRLSALPEALATASGVLQAAHSDFTTTRDASKQDQEELRRLRATNTDIQVHLAQARGAHGQVRVEKEKYSEKLKLVESDRDRLSAQADELRAMATMKEEHAMTLEQRNKELEEALSKALTRLQASDVQAQTNQARIVSLEKANGDLAAEKNTLKTKIESLEMQALFAAHDKENIVISMGSLQQQYDTLAAQQSHWDDLRRTSQQIESLTQLISHADNEELSELRRVRDQSRTMEADHGILQKRHRELETKVATGEKVAAAARQGLSQAQDRALEWERRAQESEGKFEMTKTQLEQIEQSHSSLEADFSLIKQQLDDKEANDRLAQDSERKLREQVVSLEAIVARLQAEAKQAMSTPYTNGATSPPALIKGYNGRASHYNEKSHAPSWGTNGNALSRPDSRARTLYGPSRSGTPVGDSGRQSSASNHRPSVQDSIHAPSRRQEPVTPKVRRVAPSYRPSSPTPSTVSLAPTQGGDGWWS